MDITARTFWDSCSRGELSIQRCCACAHLQTYPRPFCAMCGHETLENMVASGRGTVYACTEVIRAPTPAFEALVPYVIALVDLDEGTRVMAHAERGLTIGEPVVLEFRAHEGLNLPHFVRAPSVNA